MIVRVCKPFYTGQNLHTLGRVLEVRDDIAATWVAQGLCEYMHRTKEIETAVIKSKPEQAVTRRRKKA